MQPSNPSIGVVVPIALPNRVTITCTVHVVAGPPHQLVTVHSPVGLASITGVQVTNGTVSVPPFKAGTTGPVVVTVTTTDQLQPITWRFVATDIVGDTQGCE